MRIIQISDSHISEPDQLLRGVDVRGNYRRLLRTINQNKPDLIVHTGDLCAHTGDREIYRWIQSIHQEILGDTPVITIPGNHDDTVIQADCFDMKQHLKGQELYFEYDLSKHELLFLDSASGHISETQKAWLIQKLKSGHMDHQIIFMHHPPCLCGVPYMDQNYALENREEIMQVLTQADELRISVFCGHYHVEKSIHFKNVDVFITPSSYFQIDAAQQDFAVDHYLIGFRTIEWRNDVLYTAVHYLQ